MDDTRFELLEQLNAQVDIWIDQEQFDSVINAFKCSPSDKETDLNDYISFEEHLKDAFSHAYCTVSLNEKWDALLNVTPPPWIEFRFLDNNWVPFHNNDRELDEKWARFFWAKLIRAKIQQKGSDCYFNKLDQLVVYLERNQPVVGQDSDQTNKLAVIYLLEMAASGLAADQRSFADRARRILIDRFKEIKEHKYFFNFYDILARYSIGLGYQHEGRNRDAVREFNFIIKELHNFWNEAGTSKSVSPADHLWVQYVNKRYGLEYLYLPAVLGRAGIEIKLQLAYHALDTVNKYWKDTDKQHHLAAKKEHLLAEANRLMGSYGNAKANLLEVAKILIGICKINPSSARELPVTLKDRLEQINKVNISKWSNIKGRLLDTYVALHLDKLKGDTAASQAESLEPICEIFSMYWESSEWQATNRTGYFELVAAYLGWIAKRKAIDSDDALKAKAIAEELYKKNKEHFPIHKKQDAKGRDIPNRHTCPTCTQLGIKLERLGPSHYQEFVKNMRDFYSEFNTGEDSNCFREQIFEIEKEHREDSAYQKRKMAMAQLGDAPPDWCKKCLGEKTTPGGTRIAFSRLLNCADSHENSSSLRTFFSGLFNFANFHEKNNDNQPKQGESLSLDKNHYEHLMDYWDKRFLKHLEIESVHFPRCKALHLLGLQRWNSTSPAIGRSLGGGYFLYHTNKNGRVDLGVVIDPGFDFVRNLFHLGFSLSDIDVVLLSHAHLDHIRDFESLVTLCLELNKRHPDKVKRRLHTVMTLGVYRRLSHIFESTGLREFVEPYILDIEKEIIPNFLEPYIEVLEYYDPFLKPNGSNHKPHEFVFQEIQEILPREGEDRGQFRFLSKSPAEPNKDKGLRLSITATRAYHNDFSESSDSFGFKIKISAADKETDTCTIGYTGDTSWSPDIIEQYKNCDALLVHLGSLINRGKDIRFDDYTKDGQKCWNLVKEKNHPYLFGLLRFLTQIANQKSTESGKVPLVLLSEFGEELRGRIRLDLYNRLSKHYNGKNGLSKIPLLPLDVGLDVILALDDVPIDESKFENLKSHKGARDCARLRILKNNDSPFLVKCVACEEFIVPKQVDFETYGHDEGLYCVCEACRRSTPQNVLQDKLRDLYEVARPLQSHY